MAVEMKASSKQLVGNLNGGLLVSLALKTSDSVW